MISTLKHIFRPCKSFFDRFIPFPKQAKPIYHKSSYSQEGEDMILSRIFEEKDNGFYVDVGAHHPQRFSNTYYFYLQGWRGINIDARPGSMANFDEGRARDINLEIAISDSQNELNYYGFNDPALNSFCKEVVDEYRELDNYKVVFEKKLKTFTLAEVLDKYLPPDQEIDFLSLDVEGVEYQVLKSNNWLKYRPKVVLVEELRSFSLTEIGKSEIVKILEKNNYRLYCKTPNTLIFFKS